MSGLVSPDWLEQRLGDPSLVLLEVSSKLPPEAAWFSGHIPGARYIYWKDLCWDDTDRQFPSTDVMAERLGALGVGDDSTVVLIGDTVQFATYPYWVMTMAGLEARAVLLDGGHQAWEAQGRPMTTDAPPPPIPKTLTPGVEDWSSRLGRDDVLAHLDDPARVLVDMRSDEEYFAQRVSPTTWAFDHGAERKGRIPGARHLYYENLLHDDGTFKSPEELESLFDGVGATGDRDVVTYCRLSHRASLGWFALTRLNDRNSVRVYDGSWTEWGSMVGMPIER
jgi:thiosulfate/3-mercaptopyruvate sulfurtransferase